MARDGDTHGGGCGPDSAAGASPRAAGSGTAGRAATESERRLWRQARAAARHAYAPYSGFAVGAALETDAREVFTGVNVENASYPVGLCAERAALGAAVTAGRREFARIAVATDGGTDVAPCGACLQALAEFGELNVVVTDGAGPRSLRLRELLSVPFRSERTP